MSLLTLASISRDWHPFKSDMIFVIENAFKETVINIIVNKMSFAASVLLSGLCDAQAD